MRNALESNARRWMRNGSDETDEPPCWQVEVETNIFFTTADKSRFLSPDFLIRRDADASWDISAARAYELALISAAGLAVKPLRPAVYVLVGEWEPGDAGIDLPEPFGMQITWDDLAF
jgi:hypothetical protein